MSKICTILLLCYSSFCFSQTNSQTIKVKKKNGIVGEWVWTSFPDTAHDNRIDTRRFVFNNDGTYFFYEEHDHIVSGKWKLNKNSLDIAAERLKGEDGKTSTKYTSLNIILKNDSMTLYFPIGPRLFIRKK